MLHHAGRAGMDRLGLDTFIGGSDDLEVRQYHILQGLKMLHGELDHNRLYPALAELIDLMTVLDDFLQRKTDIQSRLPHRVQGLDIEKKQLIYEPVKGKEGDVDRAAALIDWALPRIRELLDEGAKVYKFVDDHISIEHVGIMPMYREEGYWFVPENASSRLHLLRYQVALFTSATERFRALKTNVLESIEQAYVRHSLEAIKLDLIGKYHDMPNPATYACETDLDFPYAETILPVAKRKLMKAVFS